MDKTVDWTKPIQTRDGRRVRLYSTDVGYDGVHAAVSLDDGRWMVGDWGIDGREIKDHECDRDIINVPEEPIRHSALVNIYNLNGSLKISGPFTDSEQATKHATFVRMSSLYGGLDDSPIACVRVEFTEGQFDE